MNVQYKFCQSLDSNRAPLELEANALPTESQPLPCPLLFMIDFSTNHVDINGSCKLRMGKVENFAVENSSKICNNLVMLKYNLRQPI